MLLRHAAGTAAATFLLLAASAPAATPPAALPLQDHYRPGELIVGYRAPVAAPARAALRARYGLVARRTLRVAGQVELVRVRPPATVVGQARRLRALAQVAYAEPNYLPVETAVVPNDPRFIAQWAHRNLGGGNGYVLDADIDTPQAWGVTTGSATIKLGIADSGLARTHEDLAGNLYTNPGEIAGNGVDDDHNGYVDDVHGWDFLEDDNSPADGDGHGTLMAGVAAAVANNGIGVAGVNWHAAIVPLLRGDAATVAEAFTYAGANGLRVVNNSFAIAASAAVANAVAGAPNTLFVASAGNAGNSDEGRDVYPCTIPQPNVVCVASSDADDTLSDFSNYGATSVDLAAPGGWGIVSPTPTWTDVITWTFDAGLSGWATGAISGTSRWGPHPGAGVNGTGALSDSPGTDYAANSQTWARSPVFTLAGRDGCLIDQTWRGTLTNANLFWGFSDDGTTWFEKYYAYGLPAAFEAQQVPTVGLNGSATARLRYKLWTGASVADGATIDDVRVRCLGPTQTAYLTFTGGTSAASAYVSGAAALLLAKQPSLTAAEVRTRLIQTVDVRPAFQGKVVSNGRLNVARLVGAKLPPENAVAPATGGAFTIGSTVTCSQGTWAEQPASFAYKWTRDGTAIAGATTNTYKPTLDDGQAQVGCTVTATNADGSASAPSRTTRVPAAPVNVTPPSISGVTIAGNRLACEQGAWRFAPTVLDYRWVLDGGLAAIGRTYAVSARDVGRRLTCWEGASNGDGTTWAESAPVSVQAAPVVGGSSGPPTTTTPTQTTPTQTTTTPTTTEPPALKLTLALVRGQKLATVLSRGLRLTVTASRPGSASVTAAVSRREARRLKLKSTTLGRVTVAVAQPGQATGGRIRLSRTVAARLKRASSVRLSVTARYRDAAYDATASKTVSATLRRR